MRNERWFVGIRSTPERERVYLRMCAEDEGLGPRAYRCLLQLADRNQPTPADVEWLTDGIEQPSIARMDGDRCVLTAYGRLLARAVDSGDAEMIFALTTMPEIMEASRP